MIVVGDCREVMAGMGPDSVDAIVTDPPYELGFMSKKWDGSGVAYDVATWAAAYRVLKPGGHLLAFGGSRTYHRMACAVEDAGFEIRDQIQWLYGSGFPKSLDVGKAIDKMAGRQGKPVCALKKRLRDAFSESGKTLAAIDSECGFTASGYLRGAGPQTRPPDPWRNVLPSPEKWETIKCVIGCGDDLDAYFVEAQREVIGLNSNVHRAARIVQANGGGGIGFGAGSLDDRLTAPATDLARQWDGWGTALKPAHEPIVVARKPLIGTVAANVERYGTGAINVDGCRITIDDDGGTWGARQDSSIGYGGTCPDGYRTQKHPSGRWPANVCLDEEAAAALDEQTGHLHRAGNKHLARPNGGGSFGGGRIGAEHVYQDSGGPSRFFYCSKASRKERERGLADLDWRDGPSGDYGTKAKNLTRKDGGPNEVRAVRNHHPCVKPVALMRWLVRLVTPPGGLVLDPFAGSGTTGIACVLEGFEFMGIEQDVEYAEIAEKRIAAVEPTLFAEVTG